MQPAWLACPGPAELVAVIGRLGPAELIAVVRGLGPAELVSGARPARIRHLDLHRQYPQAAPIACQLWLPPERVKSAVTYSISMG